MFQPLLVAALSVHMLSAPADSTPSSASDSVSRTTTTNGSMTVTTTTIITRRVSPPPQAPVVRPVPATLMGRVDHVVVEKRAHRMTLYSAGVMIRQYLVALGASPEQDKVAAGDRRTPEGTFWVDNKNPESQYHLSLHISYPDARHRTLASQLGLSPGGDIMIHGLPNGRHSVGAFHRTRDWTNGCIALTDEEIDEIWNLVPVGARVDIKA